MTTYKSSFHSTEDEKLQMGLPIGGRRVIARRQINPEQPKELGTVHLAIYVKFLEAGIYTLDDLSLECSIVNQASGDFARYAAHLITDYLKKSILSKNMNVTTPQASQLKYPY